MNGREGLRFIGSATPVKFGSSLRGVADGLRSPEKGAFLYRDSVVIDIVDQQDSPTVEQKLIHSSGQCWIWGAVVLQLCKKWPKVLANVSKRSSDGDAFRSRSQRRSCYVQWSIWLLMRSMSVQTQLIYQWWVDRGFIDTVTKTVFPCSMSKQGYCQSPPWHANPPAYNFS